MIQILSPEKCYEFELNDVNVLQILLDLSFDRVKNDIHQQLETFFKSNHSELIDILQIIHHYLMELSDTDSQVVTLLTQIYRNAFANNFAQYTDDKIILNEQAHEHLKSLFKDIREFKNISTASITDIFSQILQFDKKRFATKCIPHISNEIVYKWANNIG
eukprot:370653_1